MSEDMSVENNPFSGSSQAVSTTPGSGFDSGIGKPPPPGRHSQEPTGPFKPKKSHKFRNRFLAPLLVLGLGGAAAGVATQRGSGEAGPTPTTRPAASATTLPESPTTIAAPPTTAETPQQVETRELQSRFDAFFNMSNEEFTTYADENYFRLDAGLDRWNFPDLSIDRNSMLTQHDNSNGPDTLTYHTPDGQSNTIEAGPHFSLIRLSEKKPQAGSEQSLYSWQFVGINAGIHEVAIKSGDYQSVTVMDLAMVLPQSLGGKRVILPVIVDVNSSNPDKQNYAGFTVPYAREANIDHSLQDSDASAFGSIEKNELAQRLKDNIGKPISVLLANQGGYPADRQVPDINDTVPDPSGLLRAFKPLLLGDVSGFEGILQAAGESGYVMTAEKHEVPDYIINGFTDINDALNHAPVGSPTFLKTPTGLPALQSAA